VFLNATLYNILGYSCLTPCAQYFGLLLSDATLNNIWVTAV